MPLANGFFKAFHLLPTSQGFQAHVGPFISFLEHYRGVSPFDVPQWNEDIERFMTSIEDEIAELRTAIGRKSLSEKEFMRAMSLAMVFNNMNFILANVINEAQNGPSNSAYRILLDFCSPNDAFISFNWDTLLDRALVDTGGWSPSQGYGLQFTAALDSTWKSTVEGEAAFDTKWKLLKLHGSTNWLVPHVGIHFDTLEYESSVPGSNNVFLYWQSALPYATHKSRWHGGYAPTCYCYYPPNIPGSYFTQKQLTAKPGHIFVRLTPKIFSPFSEPDPSGVPSSPLLITPVRQKKYDRYEKAIRGLWQQAEDLLRNASRIVIVGYSFPPTDTRGLALLRGALSSRPGQIAVEIVAPDATAVISRIGRTDLLDASSVMPFDLRFEDYIYVLADKAGKLMKFAASKKPEVMQWLKLIYALNHAPRQ